LFRHKKPNLMKTSKLAFVNTPLYVNQLFPWCDEVLFSSFPSPDISDQLASPCGLGLFSFIVRLSFLSSILVPRGDRFSLKAFFFAPPCHPAPLWRGSPFFPLTSTRPSTNPLCFHHFFPFCSSSVHHRCGDVVFSTVSGNTNQRWLRPEEAHSCVLFFPPGLKRFFLIPRVRWPHARPAWVPRTGFFPYVSPGTQSQLSLFLFCWAMFVGLCPLDLPVSFFCWISPPPPQMVFPFPFFGFYVHTAP